MHLISIIMPAFNSALTIEESIYSVLNQTYSHFELIICDDSSTDLTYQIITKIASNDSRVKLISNSFSKGAAGARNSCLDHAQGQYICFLDSDDYWDSDKLEKQLHFMLSSNIEFSYSNYYMFTEKESKVINSRPFNNFESLSYTCDIGCLTVMLSKNLIGDLRFPYIAKEDYAFWLLILKKNAIAYNSGMIGCFYRKQTNSLSGNKFKEVFRQYKVLRDVAGFKRLESIKRLITYCYHALRKHNI